MRRFRVDKGVYKLRSVADRLKRRRANINPASGPAVHKVYRPKSKRAFMLTEVLLSILIIALTVGGVFSVITMSLVNMRYVSEQNELRSYASQVSEAIIATNNSGGYSIVNVVNDLYGKAKLPYTINWDELCNTLPEGVEQEDGADVDTGIVDWVDLIPEDLRTKYKTEITFIPSSRVLTDIGIDLKGTNYDNSVGYTDMTTLKITVTKLVDDRDSIFLGMLGLRRSGALTYYLTLRADDSAVGRGQVWGSVKWGDVA